MSVYCVSSDRFGNPCRNHPENTETRFCIYHKYMNTYTEEQMQNLKLCSGCHKWVYLSPECGKRCSNCLNISRIKNAKEKEKRRENNESKTPCSVENCKWYCAELSKYCAKHKIKEFVDETTAEGKKVCYNYVRGCREQLELSYKYSRCEPCLVKEREKDGKRREKFLQEHEEKCNKLNAEVRTEENEMIVCRACNQTYPKDYYIGERGGITKGCKICREKDKVKDAKRDKEHRREQGRKYDSKPERKEAKKKWDEENADKRAMTWMNYRQRQIEQKGEEYWKKNAEQQKKWRENNPEKVKEANEKRNNCVNEHFNIYKKSAKTKNIEFNLTKDEYMDLAEKQCYYCGIMMERGFNGIDRKSSAIGYNTFNCVSCCTLCNYLKGAIDPVYFIKRVFHILSYQNMIDDNSYYPEAFSSSFSSSYNDYFERANRKNIEFNLTNEEFYELINCECYICGKENSDNHINGIDRVDNNKGYDLENTKSCCGECNCMKKSYEYNTILDKFMEIYKNTKETSNIDYLYINVDENNSINNKVITKNRRSIKSEEDTKEYAKIKTQNARERMREKYGDEEYKKRRALEISEYRKIKKQQMEEKKVNNEDIQFIEEQHKEINEKAKLCNQKYRNKLRETLGEEEYKRQKAEQMAKYRFAKKNNNVSSISENS